MKDLTQGSITKHLVEMAIPMAIGMLAQTLYFIIDLIFVAKLGPAAIAGVSTASASTFAVMALTQMLGVGSVALIAHAVGAKDQPRANLIFNQSLVLSGLCGLIVLFGGYAAIGPYLRALAADAPTVAAGTTYLQWYLPGLALQFAMIALGSALRGTGIVAPTMVVQLVTVVLNCILAPVLIGGIGTGHPLGVAGAGLASTISIAVGVAVLAAYYLTLEKYVAFHNEQWKPRLDTWLRILNIGFPAGGEFALMTVYMSVVYFVVSGFGAEAQAGVGIGSRVMQAVFLPVMAISFAVAPVAGQNFGARNAARVRETFRDAMRIGGGLMLVVAVLTWCFARQLIGFFVDASPGVVDVGATFLRFVCLNFVFSGLIFTCSGMFQALGNTWPSVLASATRLVTFALPVLWLSRQPSFHIEQVWYVSVGTVWLQALVSFLLVRREMAKRLQFAT